MSVMPFSKGAAVRLQREIWEYFFVSPFATTTPEDNFADTFCV